jgi:hypothetical protein
MRAWLKKGGCRGEAAAEVRRLFLEAPAEVITYVSPDGSEEDGPRFELPMPSVPDRTWQQRKRRWRYRYCRGF